jgi:hypothetical protein
MSHTRIAIWHVIAHAMPDAACACARPYSGRRTHGSTPGCGEIHTKSRKICRKHDLIKTPRPCAGLTQQNHSQTAVSSFICTDSAPTWTAEPSAEHRADWGCAVRRLAGPPGVCTNSSRLFILHYASRAAFQPLRGACMRARRAIR